MWASPANAGDLGLGPVTRVASEGGSPELVLAPRPSPLTTLRVQFRTGSYDDGPLPGLSKLSILTLLYGNQVLPYASFARDLYESAAALSIDSDPRSTAVILTTSARDFERLGRTLLSLMLAPRLSESRFESARLRTLRHSLESEADEITTAFAQSVLSDPGFEGEFDGDQDTLREIEFSAVQRQVSAHFTPANATVIVAGQLEAAKVTAWVRAFRGGIRRPNQRSPKDLPGTYFRESMLEIHLFAFAVDLSTAEKAAAAHLAAAILDEAVFNRLRRLGMAYSTKTAVVHREWLDFLMIAAPINPARSMNILDLVQAEVDRVRKGEVPAETLERNKTHLLSERMRIDSDPRLLSRHLAWSDGAFWEGQVSNVNADALVRALGPALAKDRCIHALFSRDVPEGGR
ncbi:MAG: insulinase family protein [Deltaproteobacteria bacterium]|nr:insulinase family protein [Deltaproteobacteria bacterium]